MERVGVEGRHRPVGRGGGLPEPVHDGGDGDDARAVGGLQQRQQRAHKLEVSDERDAEVEAKPLRRPLSQPGGDACVANEGVEAGGAEACGEGGGEGVDARKLREVEHHRDRPPAFELGRDQRGGRLLRVAVGVGVGVGRNLRLRLSSALELRLGSGLDLRGGRLRLCEVAAGEDDCRAEPGELGGGAQPDATVGTGHNAHFAAEVGAG